MSYELKNRVTSNELREFESTRTENPRAEIKSRVTSCENRETELRDSSFELREEPK